MNELRFDIYGDEHYFSKRNQWNYDYISYVKEHVEIKLNELWKDNIYVLELDLELD